jgi:CheY-like chemotaxis protein
VIAPELVRQYRQALRRRIARIEAARSTAASTSSRSAILAEAHALRGSGATYGFPEITEAAIALEQARPTDFGGRVETLLRVLDAVARGDAFAAGSGRDAHGASWRVLIVDDDPEIVLVAAAALRAAGHDVATASGIAEAAALAAAYRPVVVLLDVMLGEEDGLAGLEVIAAACGCPVIFLTGHGGEAAEQRMAESGAAGVIAKPFDPFELPHLVGALLAGG